MPQSPVVPVPLDRERVVFRIEEYLHTKGMNKKQLAVLLGYNNPQSVTNFLIGKPKMDENGAVVGVSPMSRKILGQWCEKMGYPLEDLLNDRPYAEPGTVTALENEIKRTREEVKELREELEALKRRFEIHIG